MFSLGELAVYRVAQQSLHRLLKGALVHTSAGTLPELEVGLVVRDEAKCLNNYQPSSTGPCPSPRVEPAVELLAILCSGGRCGPIFSKRLLGLASISHRSSGSLAVSRRVIVIRLA